MKKLKPFRAWVVVGESNGVVWGIYTDRARAKYISDAATERIVEVLCTPVARKRKARKAKP